MNFEPSSNLYVAIVIIALFAAVIALSTGEGAVQTTSLNRSCINGATLLNEAHKYLDASKNASNTLQQLSFINYANSYIRLIDANTLPPDSNYDDISDAIVLRQKQLFKALGHNGSVATPL